MERSSYNPDVLNCLANLSNDEVFTPPAVATQMLDLLPQELFRSPETRFLDPFSKSGVFLREVVKRLDRGLQATIPDRQQRIDHIMHHQVFGIAITELTAQLSRRTLYCSKDASSHWSVSHFGSAEGNVQYHPLRHTWNATGKCQYCGASKAVWDRAEEAEQHAYEFIHTYTPQKLFHNMKFDVIIGNPPYQIQDGGGTGDSARPIYQLFISQAKLLNPHYLIMITPSRWMKGGKGLDEFRQKMIADTRIRALFDYEDASECFPGVHIDGGVSYFIWESTHNGPADYTYKPKDGEPLYSRRYLKEDFSDTVIRDPRQISIIRKVDEGTTTPFSSIVSPRNPFGLFADLFNDPQKYPDIIVYEEPSSSRCKIYGVKGKKGGAKRLSGYIDRPVITKNTHMINGYKLFFSKAFTTTATVPPEVILGEPGDVSTETFLLIGTFDDSTKRDNCLSYIKTKFFRALLFFNRHSLNISQESFASIPLQDFSHPWTDEMLYKKYGLEQKEIDFIESMIRPMD